MDRPNSFVYHVCHDLPSSITVHLIKDEVKWIGIPYDKSAHSGRWTDSDAFHAASQCDDVLNFSFALD
jgi:hypothetical protein